MKVATYKNHDIDTDEFMCAVCSEPIVIYQDSVEEKNDSLVIEDGTMCDLCDDVVHNQCFDDEDNRCMNCAL